MQKAILAVVLLILLIVLAIVIILSNYIVSAMNTVSYILIGAFIVIFGLMLGIKYMSDQFR